MSCAIAKVWDEEAVTRQIAGVFRDALALGPQVIRLNDERELVMAEREPTQRAKHTPREYVRRIKLTRPDPDPFDGAIEQARGCKAVFVSGPRGGAGARSTAGLH